MKPDPKIGLVPWVCQCGAVFSVSADADDDTGWPQAYEHRKKCSSRRVTSEH